MHHKNAERISLVLQKGSFNANESAWTHATQAALAPMLEMEIPEIEKAFRIFSRPIWVSSNDRSFQTSICFADTGFVDSFTFPARQGDTRKILRKPNAVMISESYAKRMFGNKDPIGEILHINYKWGLVGDFVVEGILRDPPATTSWRFSPDFLTLAIPTAFKERRWNRSFRNSPVGEYYTWVLLREGVTNDTLTEKLTSAIRRHMPKETAEQSELGLISLSRLHHHLEEEFGINDTRNEFGDISTVHAFGLVGIFIILIASTNFVNLTTARSMSRAKEVGVRKALGASRNSLIRQFFLESMCITGVAAGLAYITSKVLGPILDTSLLTGLHAGATLPDLLLITIAVGALSGIYPAFYLSRFEPSAVLRSAANPGASEQFIRQGLVVLQFAVSIFLLIATITISRQLTYIQKNDLGFDVKNLINLPFFQSERDANMNHEFVGRVRNAFTSHPGVSHASASLHPIGIYFSGDDWFYALERRDAPRQRISSRPIDEAMIKTLGLRILAGRDFSPDGTHEVILNESAARLLSNGTNPETLIGKQVFLWDNPLIIRGIMADFHFQPLHKKIAPFIFVHRWAEFRHFTVRILPEHREEALAHLKTTWNRFIPNRAFTYTYLEDLYRTFYKDETSLRTMISIMSYLTIFTACLGLIGLAAFSAQRRTKEIGIRKALGATEPQIVQLLVSEYAKLVGISILIACPISWYLMSNWLAGFAYKIDLSLDVFTLSALAVLTAALGTVAWQSLSAAKQSPVNTLRDE